MILRCQQMGRVTPPRCRQQRRAWSSAPFKSLLGHASFPSSAVASSPENGPSGSELPSSRKIKRTTSPCSALKLQQPSDLPFPDSVSPPLWVGVLCLIPVLAWSLSWLVAVGMGVNGAYASLWACTYFAATAWADIAPGSAAGTVDYTDMALRSIHRGPFDPLGLLHASPHHHYSQQGLPWALDAHIVRTLLPLAHKGWVTCQGIAIEPGTLLTLAAAQVSLMAASAIFLAVQTPLGPTSAALGHALRQAGASCIGLVERWKSKDAGASKASSDEMSRGQSSSSSSIIENSKGEQSSCSSRSSGLGGNSPRPVLASDGTLDQASLPPPSGVSVQGDGSTLPATDLLRSSSSRGSEARGHTGSTANAGLDPRSVVSVPMMRTAAQLGLVALSTYVAVTETSVPLMTGDWATQPATILYVLATVIGDLALPAAVFVAALASALVGLWQGLSSNGRAITEESRSSGVGAGSGIRIKGSSNSSKTSRDENDNVGSSNSGGDGSTESNINSSGKLASRTTGTAEDDLGTSSSVRPEDSSTSSSHTGSNHASSQTGSGSNCKSVGTNNNGSGRQVEAGEKPAWLSSVLLAVCGTRAVLDVALSLSVATGWLSGQVSAVRIVALLLLLRICWSEHLLLRPHVQKPI